MSAETTEIRPNYVDLQRTSHKLIEKLKEKPLVPYGDVKVYYNGLVRLTDVLELIGYPPEAKPHYYAFYNVDGIITLVPMDMVVNIARKDF